MPKNNFRHFVRCMRMDKHEEKYCPRCSQSFTCKVGDIASCQCTAVQLTEKARIFLSKTFFDCLCKDCMMKINQETARASAYHFPTQKEMFIEGLHYYKENGYWVFTELYHMLRGYCCGNNCRHCVYGFSKTNKIAI